VREKNENKMCERKLEALNSLKKKKKIHLSNMGKLKNPILKNYQNMQANDSPLVNFDLPFPISGAEEDKINLEKNEVDHVVVQTIETK
jgi:hypothetical protein